MHPIDNPTELNTDPITEGDIDPTLAESNTGEGGEGGEELTPATYLRDLSEDDVYNRLGQVAEFPSHLSGLESRFTGNLNDVSSRLTAMEKLTPTQSSFDTDALAKVLTEYDPKLAEVLVPALQNAFKTNALDENTLRPHLDPMQQKMQEYVGEQIVMSSYSPEQLNEIIPPVSNGQFAPESQRHNDFVGWYAQQGFSTQQALLSFGAPYITALRSFEKWEQSKNKKRADTSATKTNRLANGQVPTSQNRVTPKQKTLTADEALAAGFEEAFKEVNG